MNTYIVFQSYGAPALLDECKFALLRLYRMLGDQTPQVVVYTDQPHEFEPFAAIVPLTIREMNAQLISQWKGQHQFVHRVKIEVIKDCLAGRQGKLIYMDSDTCVTSALPDLLERISAAQVVFHIPEGKIGAGGNLHFRKWKQFLQSAPNPALQFPDPLHIEMWNAGVIGLHNSHLPLLDEVLALTDELYPLFPRHTVEQFAFCYTFQKNNIHISEAADIVFHYWNLKEFRILLGRFFTQHAAVPLQELAALTDSIQPQPIVNDKMQFEQLPFFKKIIQKAKGNTWSINRYYV
ncbi:hypothetical protein [Filimonas effusa]|uniref:Glycosyl transferase n=1 Tax=Filimonas effusa TaxID=2508721 RepID=A0A4Q1D145_9BACT|nr:hypothetical protein [Filimonas effusa]RXK80944.1 hypothetical protein ESB13_22580 [Filimonas effusa]